MFFTDRKQSVEIGDEFDFWTAEQVLTRKGLNEYTTDKENVGQIGKILDSWQ